MDDLGKSYLFPIYMAQGFLYMAEYSPCYREYDIHISQLIQFPVPLVDTYPLLSDGGGLYVGKKIQGNVDRVYELPQENLARGPGTITYVQLLQRENFLLMLVVHRIQGEEELVQCM